MKIHGNQPLDGTPPIPSQGRTDRAPTAPEKSDRPADRLEVSEAARELTAIRNEALRAPEVRAGLVAHLRGEVDAGRYEPDLRVVARRLLEDLGDFRQD